jgi:hypothetical protein
MASVPIRRNTLVIKSLLNKISHNSSQYGLQTQEFLSVYLKASLVAKSNLISQSMSFTLKYQIQSVAHLDALEKIHRRDAEVLSTEIKPYELHAVLGEPFFTESSAVQICYGYTEN